MMGNPAGSGRLLLPEFRFSDREGCTRCGSVCLHPRISLSLIIGEFPYLKSCHPRQCLRRWWGGKGDVRCELGLAEEPNFEIPLELPYVTDYSRN